MEQESTDRLLTIQQPWPTDQLGTISRLLPRLSEWPRTLTRDEASPIRFASHLALLAVTVLVLTLTQVQWPDWDIPWRLSPSAPQPAQLAAPALNTAHIDTRPIIGGSLIRAAVPITKIPERPREGITHYIVAPGDTLGGIAEKFGVSTDTVKWANELDLNPDMLRVGQELIILPASGVYHVVAQGETLSKIALRYKVQPETIANYKLNELKDINEPLAVDKVLIIPGGEKPYVAPYVATYSGPVPKSAQTGAGRFMWPATGHITSLFGQIARGGTHRGLDIGSWTGAPVSASDSGYVSFAGWDRSGYGNLIIVDHGNGFVTYYAHLSKMLVKRGDSVAQGQRIGSVGCTGRCTGPHLHFEVHSSGAARNPLGFLP